MLRKPEDMKEWQKEFLAKEKNLEKKAEEKKIPVAKEPVAREPKAVSKVAQKPPVKRKSKVVK